MLSVLSATLLVVRFSLFLFSLDISRRYVPLIFCTLRSRHALDTVCTAHSGARNTLDVPLVLCFFSECTYLRSTSHRDRPLLYTLRSALYLLHTYLKLVPQRSTPSHLRRLPIWNDNCTRVLAGRVNLSSSIKHGCMRALEHEGMMHGPGPSEPTMLHVVIAIDVRHGHSELQAARAVPAQCPFLRAGPRASARLVRAGAFSGQHIPTRSRNIVRVPALVRVGRVL
ncbi:hypothetical protein C8Q73DRAFT_186591 [Cubamyces lactineus]|nr:hypothetical protein C8Q73DRAFT_186591 [Cubamyces lactineus]